MNVLLLSVGRQTYLVERFRKADGWDNVFVGDSSSQALALRSADKSFVMPSFTDARYFEFLEQVIVEHHVDALISLHDLETVLLAQRSAALLDLGARFIGPTHEVALACFDKLLTADLLASCGVASPRTFSSVERVLGELAMGTLHFPLILKPRWGMASKGISTVTTTDELRFFYDYLRRTSAPAPDLDGVTSTQDVVVIQEFIVGEEFGVDIINNLRGDFEVAVTKKKLAMRGGETDRARLAYDPAIDALSRRISSRFRHLGSVDCDLLKRDGQAYVIDLNPRFGGGYIFSLAGGVDLPDALGHWCAGGAPQANWKDYRVGDTYGKATHLVRLEES